MLANGKLAKRKAPLNRSRWNPCTHEEGHFVIFQLNLRVKKTFSPRKHKCAIYSFCFAFFSFARVRAFSLELLLYCSRRQGRKTYFGSGYITRLAQRALSSPGNRIKKVPRNELGLRLFGWRMGRAESRAFNSGEKRAAITSTLPFGMR